MTNLKRRCSRILTNKIEGSVLSDVVKDLLLSIDLSLVYESPEVMVVCYIPFELKEKQKKRR